MNYMDTAPFWDGAQEGHLMLQYCKASGRWQAYPRPGSVYTGQRRLEWRAASGLGTLCSWTVDRMAPDSAGGSPRIQALVDLAEGPRLLTWLVGEDSRLDPASLHTGQPVQVAWVEIEGGRRWPAFRPLTNASKETT